MRRFFEEHKLDTDGLSEERINNIKASVLARVEGDKPMKKWFKFKPLVIAAAVVGAMALSAVSVNAATNGAFLSMIFKTHVKTTLTTKYGDVYVEVKAYSDGDPYEGKPSGTSIKTSYSKDFTGHIVSGFSRGIGNLITDEDAGCVHVDIMPDGDAIGYMVVFRTGEVTLLTNEEVQKVIEDFDEEQAKFEARAKEIDLGMDGVALEEISTDTTE